MGPAPASPLGCKRGCRSTARAAPWRRRAGARAARAGEPAVSPERLLQRPQTNGTGLRARALAACPTGSPGPRLRGPHRAARAHRRYRHDRSARGALVALPRYRGCERPRGARRPRCRAGASKSPPAACWPTSSRGRRPGTRSVGHARSGSQPQGRRPGRGTWAVYRFVDRLRQPARSKSLQ